MRKILSLVIPATIFACSPASTDPRDSGVDSDFELDESDVRDAAIDEAADGSADTVVDADATTDGIDESDAAEGSVPEYSRVYRATETLQAREGFRWARSIIHFHSTHSHDACDGMPRGDNGEYNIPCLMTLRGALCTNRIDMAWLTDHPTHMTEIPFEAALLHLPEEGDTLLTDALGRPYANSFDCANGHQVTVMAGSEDSLMPLGLHGHLAYDPTTRDAIQNLRTPEAAATMREYGALIWQAHSEQRTTENLIEVELDGMEVYQLHANIDPSIRRDSLGLDPTAPLTDLAPFLFGGTVVPPDLAMLAFLEENRPSLDRWASILARQPIVGSAGTDAHENVFRSIAVDGERLDSYRRMISWFSNYIFIRGELTPESARAALADGRNTIVFNILGDFDGFDAYVQRGDTIDEMGSTSTWSGDQSLRVHVPALRGPSGIAANIATYIWRADGEGWVQVGEVLTVGEHIVPLTQAGIYRVEVRTTAEHLAPYLVGGFEHLATREYPWIYTNAWRVLAE